MREVDYPSLQAQAEALLSAEPHRIASAANLSALLAMELPEINWVGFYFLEGDELVLGPFQGKPACTRIPLGQGVCGVAAVQGRTLRVADVHRFDGHIACDTASNSELVIPLSRNGAVFGVLDIDSPRFDRFTAADESGLAAIVRLFERLSA